MCKLIPQCHASPAAAAAALPASEVPHSLDHESFDAWFDSISQELSFGAEKQSPQLDYFFDEQKQVEFDFSLEQDASHSLSVLATPVFMVQQSPPPTMEQYISPLDLILPEPTAPLVAPAEPRSRKANNCKRDTPEDPITPQVALKRQKQNDAARRCREKRLVKLHSVQQKADQVETEKFEIAVKLAVLEKEKEAWVKLEREMVLRIEDLKRKVDESDVILLAMKRQQQPY